MEMPFSFYPEQYQLEQVENVAEILAENYADTDFNTYVLHKALLSFNPMAHDTNGLNLSTTEQYNLVELYIKFYEAYCKRQQLSSNYLSVVAFFDQELGKDSEGLILDIKIKRSGTYIYLYYLVQVLEDRYTPTNREIRVSVKKAKIIRTLKEWNADFKAAKATNKS